MQKIVVKGHFFQKMEWKQTDRRTDTTDRIALPANAVGVFAGFNSL